MDDESETVISERGEGVGVFMQLTKYAVWFKTGTGAYVYRKAAFTVSIVSVNVLFNIHQACVVSFGSAL